MVDTNWTRVQAEQAAASVARLAELHRELVDALGDDRRRDELWAQIEEEHARFARLLAADES